MPPFEGPHLAREPFLQLDDSAGTSWVYCKHIQVEQSFARIILLMNCPCTSNSAAEELLLRNQRNGAFFLDGWNWNQVEIPHNKVLFVPPEANFLSRQVAILNPMRLIRSRAQPGTPIHLVV
jgi:hypothetical protein